MKTFNEFDQLTDKQIFDEIFESTTDVDLTPEQEAAIDELAETLLTEYEKGRDLDDIMNEIIEESRLSMILGGLTGFALGKSLGKIIARVLGVDKGVLYDLLTSRLVGAAIGAAIGKKI